MLFHRVGFTRQQRLLDEEIARFQHPAIRRNQIACRQERNVAGYDFGYRNLQRLAIAQHIDADGNRLAQFFRSRIGAVFLDKVQRDTEQHDATDDEKVGQLPGKCRHRAGGEQDQDQRILEAGKVLAQQGFFLPFAEQVGAVLNPSRCGLGAGQAGNSACFRQRIKPPGWTFCIGRHFRALLSIRNRQIPCCYFNRSFCDEHPMMRR